jgi:hypothetical protein
MPVAFSESQKGWLLQIQNMRSMKELACKRFVSQGDVR